MKSLEVKRHKFKTLAIFYGIGVLIFGLSLRPIKAEETTETQKSGILDQKTFVGEMGEVGKDKGDKDEFIFQNGQFRSAACDPYGFGSGDYTVKEVGNTITFEAETESPSDGIMKWKGTIRGNTLEGKANWIRQGKNPVEHWFRGTLKTSA